MSLLADIEQVLVIKVWDIFATQRRCLFGEMDLEMSRSKYGLVREGKEDDQNRSNRVMIYSHGCFWYSIGMEEPEVLSSQKPRLTLGYNELAKLM